LNALGQSLTKQGRPPVWRAIPETSQEIALDHRAQVILYTGSRGPGKTDAQLMRFRSRVGRGYGRFWRGVIFDREYKNLDDLVIKSKRWFGAFDDGARFLESGSSYKWVWPTGEELLFRTAKKEADYWDYHGQEFPYIGWNELCKYPTCELFDMLFSCNRSSFTEKDWPLKYALDKKGRRTNIVIGVTPMPPIPLECFATTNSYGPGHNWVKRRFIDPVPYGDVQRETVKVYNPATEELEDETRTIVALFGMYLENPYLDKKYIANLVTEKNKNRRKSWLLGDWNVVAGGALDDVWEEEHCVKPRFVVPKSWRIDRAFDWGSTHPFYVGWYAEANGEEAVLPDGSTFCPPRGTIVLIHEIYGTEGIGTNKGVMWSAKKIAEKIKETEIELMSEGWILSQPWPGPADNQISNIREIDVDTIEKKMSDEGIRWTQSVKSPGSRKHGLQLMRERLEANTTPESPGLVFMQHCRSALSTIPVLPRDEKDMDDVDSDAEDHPYDATRYRVLAASNRTTTRINVHF
jgi:hypothetical protein